MPTFTTNSCSSGASHHQMSCRNPITAAMALPSSRCSLPRLPAAAAALTSPISTTLHHHHHHSRAFTTIIPRASSSSNNNNLKNNNNSGGGLFDGFLDKVRNATTSLQQQTEPSEEEEEYESSEEEENTFVQLNPDSKGSIDGSSETTFGPLAILAVGFLAEELAALQSLLIEMEAEELKLIACTAEMLSSTLGEAFESVDGGESTFVDSDSSFERMESSTSTPPTPPTQAQYQASIPSSSSSSSDSSSSSTEREYNDDPTSLGISRERELKILFLSGMFASEVIEVVGAVRECEEVPDCAFAAAVPKSWSRVLGELVEDVYADHAAMALRRKAAQKQQQQSE